MARYVAKNVVATGLAEECRVQLGCCIGLVDPVSVMVNTYGTGKLPDEALAKLVRQVFPLSPHGIIDHLKLRRPVYCPTAAYGHFGRREFAWNAWTHAGAARRGEEHITFREDGLRKSWTLINLLLTEGAKRRRQNVDMLCSLHL